MESLVVIKLLLDERLWAPGTTETYTLDLYFKMSINYKVFYYSC